MLNRAVPWIAFLLIGVFVPTTVAQSPIVVTGAKRVEKYAEPGQTEVAPLESSQVVLVLEIGDISVEDFDAIPKEQMIVAAGDRQFTPSHTVSRDWQMLDPDRRPVGGLQQDRRLILLVPRDVLAFTVQFGGRPAVSFKADANIAAVYP
jgi:hypothetical protein